MPGRLAQRPRRWRPASCRPRHPPSSTAGRRRRRRSSAARLACRCRPRLLTLPPPFAACRALPRRRRARQGQSHDLQLLPVARGQQLHQESRRHRRPRRPAARRLALGHLHRRNDTTSQAPRSTFDKDGVALPHYCMAPRGPAVIMRPALACQQRRGERVRGRRRGGGGSSAAPGAITVAHEAEVAAQAPPPPGGVLRLVPLPVLPAGAVRVCARGRQCVDEGCRDLDASPCEAITAAVPHSCVSCWAQLPAAAVALVSAVAMLSLVCAYGVLDAGMYETVSRLATKCAAAIWRPCCGGSSQKTSHFC